MVVVAGSADRLLPSTKEAERLKGLIPGCRTMVLEGHGHAPLFDMRVDISDIIAGDPALEGVDFPEGGGDEPEVLLFELDYPRYACGKSPARVYRRDISADSAWTTRRFARSVD